VASLTTKTVEKIIWVGLVGITNDGDGLYLKVGRSGGSAMPWIELPAFIATLEKADDLSSKALRFTNLTACRTGEVLEAIWVEVDLEARIWTIPAQLIAREIQERMSGNICCSGGYSNIFEAINEVAEAST
jgi:integrase